MDPVTLYINLQDSAKENHSAHQGAIEKKDDVTEQVNRKLMDGKVERGQLEVPTAAGQSIPPRAGNIYKVDPVEIIADGAKMADDVLALPMWKAAPYRRFEIFGFRLSKEREDTKVLEKKFRVRLH